MKISATNKIISWLSVVSLAFLLLVSPCKVRNFFQAELGLPQTEVSNKNKSAPKNNNNNKNKIIFSIPII